MRKQAVLLALLAASFPAIGDVHLELGHNKFSTTVAGKSIQLDLEVGPPPPTGCVHWRWGAEADCPKSAVVALTVIYRNTSLFVSRSAFADLGAPSKLVVKPSRIGFRIEIAGGDAATSYVAVLEFVGDELRQRRVVNPSFANTAYEVTRFSYPQ